MNAVEFLKMLRPDGPWVITTIVPDGPTCTRSFAPGEEASAEKFIATENSEGKNIYYTVNLTGYMNSKPKKNDITHAEYQHIDADPGPEETPEAFKARVLPLFETFEPKPKFIVDSGNGLQGLLAIIRTDCSNGNVGLIEAANAGLATYFGAARGTQNVDRLLRLPGTRNYPNNKKRSLGRQPCEARLIKVNDTPCYDPKIFARFREHAAIPASTTKLLCEHNAPDRSALLFRFINECLRAGIADDVIVEAALNSRGAIRAHIGDQSQRPHEYMKRQVEQTKTKSSFRWSNAPQSPPNKLAVSSGEFVADFVPPDYLVVGWLQRRFVYSFTAATGDGKTAIALLITLLVSQGMKLGKLEFKRGGVLYFAGENPDDVRMRWMAATQQFGLTPEDIDNVYFVPGVFKFTEISERIREEMIARELALVVVDTSAAYFETDDENNNVQALAHAKRLRELSRLPGAPTVLICCHPTKNAENLVPRGGGSFLNEVDGNLTCKRDDLAVEVHWTGKFRGPDFAPLNFQLKVVTHERLKDTDGNLIQTVVATFLSDEGLSEIKALRHDDQNKVLLSISEYPRLSSRERARQLGWLTKGGDPYHMRVVRAEKELEKAHLIAKGRGDEWEFKDRGKREVERLKSKAKEQSDD
jgi:AAA domain